MERVIFKRAASGYRTVRGEVVRRIQMALKGSGYDPGDLDGIFGNDSELAIEKFKQRNGFQDPSGKVITTDTWARLMHESLPSVFELCLQLTADFEGQGFDKPAGNFDGAGLTWGIIGFTLQHGEVQGILGTVKANHPLLISQAFGPLEPELNLVLGQSPQQQLAWADRISIGSKKQHVEAAWDSAFSALGSFPEVRAIQIDRARQRYWSRAISDAARFGLQTENGLALCFDIAVQNGGIDFDVEGPRITSWIADHPSATELERRLVIADVVAENSRPQYIEDVRQRKRNVASGDGEVHGSRYATSDWGLAEFPATGA